MTRQYYAAGSWAAGWPFGGGGLTDKYPPFRLDMGGREQGEVTRATPA